MPSPNGIPTQNELAAQSAKWADAPAAGEFPLEETERIKADPDVFGWVESNGYGEVFLRSDLSFFSPTQPATADTWNLIFSGPTFRWTPAFGSPIAYYLETAARWSRTPCHVKPDVLAAMAANSEDDGRVY